MSESGLPAVLVGSGRRLFADVGGRVGREQLGMVRSARSPRPRTRVVR